jgi:predicted O-methyltransferase YrrM
MFSQNVDDRVKIDKSHAYLLTGLVMANKPTKLLEIGLGGGESCNAILKGLEYNATSFDYTIVDNWHDWGGNIPDGVLEQYGHRCKLITSSELDFIFTTQDKFDFIMSDGDHHNADKWFGHVYDNLLQENGILIYHDVNLFEDDFPNLKNILYKVQSLKINHHLFNKNSLTNERCQRGLLVIFKNGSP